LITAISNARPKIADYPFTTLHPNLGVVRVGPERSFVVADLPGLIEGASEGAGLGHLFLRHLQRTRLLLHVVDMAPFDGADPVAQAKGIVKELRKYDEALYEKPRWIVLNKLDMVPTETARAGQGLRQALRWKGPVFQISALAREGLRPAGAGHLRACGRPRTRCRRRPRSIRASMRPPRWPRWSPSMTEVLKHARRIVVKVGSSLVTNEGRGIDAEAIGNWCRQLAALSRQGREVVMVSAAPSPRA
jgi:hypothetical protein